MRLSRVVAIFFLGMSMVFLHAASARADSFVTISINADRVIGFSADGLVYGDVMADFTWDATTASVVPGTMTVGGEGVLNSFV